MEWVTSFTYLGFLFTHQADIASIFRDILVKAQRAMGSLHHFLKKSDLYHNYKLVGHLFQTLVIPVLTYGVGFWGPWLVTPSKFFKTGIDTFIVHFWKWYYRLPLATPTLPLFIELKISPSLYLVSQGVARAWDNLMLLPPNTFYTT